MIEERTETTTAEDAADRLRDELRDTVSLICRLGGGVVLEEYPGALQEELAANRRTWTDASAAGALPAPATPGADALIDSADALADELARIDATLWQIRALEARRATQ